ncbi:hypothetical protein KIW84_015464 [Lathyrus oleraceus]|uniref:Alpha-N-acetylglucosaminidase tim-barrel domain-containing protein n=1 Tax=Pisum sativum TaxID=3888 RepID=A0A9D5BQP0_PEA|nr:hypothetical protein KIW84_015464 [Pisum sativum]
MPPYKPSRQRLIVIACCAIHNYIRKWNLPDELFRIWEEMDPIDLEGIQEGPIIEGTSSNVDNLTRLSNEGAAIMTKKRNHIRDEMWGYYFYNKYLQQGDPTGSLHHSKPNSRTANSSLAVGRTKYHRPSVTCTKGNISKPAEKPYNKAISWFHFSSYIRPANNSGKQIISSAQAYRIYKEVGKIFETILQETDNVTAENGKTFVADAAIIVVPLGVLKANIIKFEPKLPEWKEAAFADIEFIRSSHIYNCDTFDENTPPVDDPEYISSLGATIFKGMQSGDNDAIWLMQGWLFTYDSFWRPPQMKALLHSVPVGNMVVLDLFAEVKPIWITSEQFYGVPYIWCMLHNFAGNIEMYGILDVVASGPIEARTSVNSTMVGVGMSMEGIEQNPIVYDLMSEMAFQHNKIAGAAS